MVKIKMNHIDLEMLKSEKDDIVNQRDTEYKQRRKQQIE